VEIRKKIEWNPEKAALLMAGRGISLEKIAEEIYAGKFRHFHNAKGQRVFVVRLENYPVAAPSVESDDHIFLKTAYKTRKGKALFQGEA
jgi:hypothetical protein